MTSWMSFLHRAPRSAGRRPARGFTPSMEGVERRALLSTVAPITGDPAPPPPATADDIKTAIDSIKNDWASTGISAKIGAALDQAYKDGNIVYGDTGGAGANRDQDTGVITISDKMKGNIFGIAYALIHEGTHAALDTVAPGNDSSVYEEYLANVYKVKYYADVIKPTGLPANPDLEKYLKPDGTIDSDKIYNDAKAGYPKLPETDPKLPVGSNLPTGVVKPTVKTTTGTD